jgi:2'-5' RNA ligase
MQVLYLDCFVEISGEPLEQAIQINEKLVENFGSQIDFSSKIEPHLTIFMGLFPAANLDRIKQNLNSINREFSPFSLTFDHFRISEEGYVFWEPKPCQKLQKLHEQVVQSLNPLRDGLIREKYMNLLSSYTEIEQQLILKFGFPWVNSLFNPHLTLGKIAPERNGSELNQLLQKYSAPEKTTLARLKLGTVGENGTVSKPD